MTRVCINTKLTPRDIENLDEVKEMLATRIERWEIDIREEGEEALFLKMAELKYGPLPD